MEIFDNITRSLAEDLSKRLAPRARVAIAASSFSIYAFASLRKELRRVRDLRFIFTAPALLAEKAPRELRELFVPRLKRERELFGSDWELKLRNKLTQKALAHDCAAWIKAKALFKANRTAENMAGFIHITTSEEQFAYLPVAGFSAPDLGLLRGNNIYNVVARVEGEAASQYLAVFNSAWQDSQKFEDITARVLAMLAAAAQDNAPELVYNLALYEIFNNFLEDAAANGPNEASGFRQSAIWNRLYDFQKDAALALIARLEKFNGCILADSVGLGKTFTALAVIKYYENRNRSVLVLAPKKIADNWLAYKANYINNPLAADRLRYDVLYHTDLSRLSGSSNGLDLGRLNWGNYDLVVIDESHNFRNGGQLVNNRQNRYLRLLDQVVRSGVKTKVLMLSATPVNNRFYDLRNQLALAYEGDAAQWQGKLRTASNIDEIFKNAQKAFNRWYKLPQASRNLPALLERLDSDFFELLDNVTIARSRKHIERYYDMGALGSFPQRQKPISIRPALSANGLVNYSGIIAELQCLNLEVYRPSRYIFPSRLEKYQRKYANLTQAGREEGIRRLMAINLLKRLESSAHSFRLTLGRIRAQIESALAAVTEFAANQQGALAIGADQADLDDDDQNIDFLDQKLQVDLADLDYVTWAARLEEDLGILRKLEAETDRIAGSEDAKLQELFGLISRKQTSPLNEGNRKILIFTAFADTAEYLYALLGPYALKRHGLHTALVTGAGSCKTTMAGLKPEMRNLLMNFAPNAQERPGVGREIDILIATDCLSEGQNLQDCDFVINYDIHWNPVRIIQRFGRIDRLGSPNDRIQLVNFWPDIELDEYINLKSRVESRMKATVLTATGDDDLLDAEERGDLEYRRRQLEQLQENMPDIEDLAGGLNIMDLGLAEFRQDLLGAVKDGDEALALAPHGIFAVVSGCSGLPPGVIFVLRKRNDEAAAPGRNRLHPFHVIYMDLEGRAHISHLKPQSALQALRLLCRGKSEPDIGLCQEVEAETDCGRNMRVYVDLLGDAVREMMGAEEESAVESLFHAGGTSALANPIHGLDEFEVICFLIIRP